MSAKPFTALQVGTVAALVLLTFAGPARGAPLAELLDRLQKQRARVQTVQMTTKSTSRQTDVTRISTIRTWEKRDGEVRKSRVLSETAIGTKPRKGVKSKVSIALTVLDGKWEWRQTRVRESIMVFKSRPATRNEFDRLRDKVRRGDARIKGKETIIGQPCVILEIVSGKGGRRARSTYWISESHGLILKSIVTNADRTSMEMTTTALQVNEPIADAKFAYTPPAGATVIDMEGFGQGRGGGAKP